MTTRARHADPPGTLPLNAEDDVARSAATESRSAAMSREESTVQRKLSQPKPQRIRADRRRGWRALIQRDVAAARHTQRARAVGGRS